MRLAGHPDVEYELTLVKPASRAADAWALVEVTIRSTGGMPITDEDFVSADDLLAAVLDDAGLDEFESPSAVMRELAWLPVRYQRALHLQGVTTNAALFAMSQQELLRVRGLGIHAVALIDAGRAHPFRRYQR